MTVSLTPMVKGEALRFVLDPASEPADWTAVDMPADLPMDYAIAVDGAVVPDLPRWRADLWERVKAIRAEKRAEGFEVDGVGRFQSDAEAMFNLLGAALGALIAIVTVQPYSIDWTLADNRTVTLSKTQMVGVFVAGMMQASAIQNRSRVLRDQIDAAQDATAMSAIDVEAGWP